MLYHLSAWRTLLGFILVFWPSITFAASQEVVIASSNVGECTLTIEANEEWHTLRLRAHHPEYKGCDIDTASMFLVLDTALARDVHGRYSSLSIGRLIDYPWLSQYVAVNAHRDRAWDSKKGKPLTMDVNKYVSQLLFRTELRGQMAPVFDRGGYKFTGVTVEKVLIGGFRDIPFYTGEIHPGRVPYDAQVWLRIQKK